MSHFTRIQTQITDQDALLDALADVGYPTVEVHEEGVALEGFLGEGRDQRAHVVIPRKQIGRLSNDIGFERQSDGTYQAWISDFDSRKHDAAWMDHLTQRYAYHATVRTLESQHFDITQQQTDVDGAIHLTLRRFS